MFQFRPSLRLYPMVTLKLKKFDTSAASGKPDRAPVRGTGAGVKPRPTLAQAQAERVDSEARYQEQQRQRYGNAPANKNRSGPARDDRPRNTAPRPDSRREGQPGQYRPDARSHAGPGARADTRPDARRDDGRNDNRSDNRFSNHNDSRSDAPRRDDRNNYSAPPNARTPSRQPGPRSGSGGHAAPRPDQRNNAFGQNDRYSEPQQRPYSQQPQQQYTQQRDYGYDSERPAPAAPTGPIQFDPARFEQERLARERNAQRQAEAPYGAQRHGPRDGPRDAPWGQRNAPAGPHAYGNKPARHRSRDDDDEDDDDCPVVEHAPGSLRISKRMSELGMASRREADEWIEKGLVRVDGQVVRELGSRVLPSQKITIDLEAREQQAQRVTVLINKPVGYVSGQAEDGYEPALVLITPQNQWSEDHSGISPRREHLRHLVPAGRLDIDSVGLLILTQDGRVAKQLVGENSEIEKEYLVRVQMKEAGTTLSEADLALLQHGLSLDGEALRPAQVEWVNEDQLRFVLREGKKRQIRRMCEAVGLEVLGLKRVRIGRVMLGDLPTGQWRYLRRDEGFLG